MSIFDRSAVNIDFLAGISIFLPPLRPFLPRGTGAESPDETDTDKGLLFMSRVLFTHLQRHPLCHPFYLPCDLCTLQTRIRLW